MITSLKKKNVAFCVAVVILSTVFVIMSVLADSDGAEEENDYITIAENNYTIEIATQGFRYSFLDDAGERIVDAHPESGVRFTAPGSSTLYDAKTTTLIDRSADKVQLEVIMENGEKAEVYIYPHENYVQFTLKPVTEETELVDTESAAPRRTIDFRTAGGLDPVYGMGDHGAQAARGGYPRDTANLFGLVKDDMSNNHADKVRFISNFSIFPRHGFAQVLFEEGRKRAAFTEEENRLGAANVKKVDSLYYFIGDMPQIYSDYKSVRENEGYHDSKPKYEMFGLGWEAYGALSWTTNQQTVTDMLQKYMDEGYNFFWGVVGSGFWKGSGSTTSFGMWDEGKYPDIEEFKEFFRSNDMKLLIGLRNNFKALPEDGGNYNPEDDGPYTVEGLENDYFIKDSDGDLLTVDAVFPSGALYLLESNNDEALEWYKEGADLWEVDGFKEDAMLYTRTYRDGKWNRINERLRDCGYYIIVRNTAYSVPGDLMRIDDTRFEHGSQFFRCADRIPINMLNFVASGAANAYPDITGAAPYGITPTDSDYQKYFVRNAVFNAVTPAMSMGRAPWSMQNEKYEEIVLKAANWHNKYSPYVYSSALHSYNRGYPHTMTPLHIAFPEDSNTYNLANNTSRQYQWMLGPSMLATPAFGNDYETAASRDVYLPEGKWIDYESGDVYHGPKTLENFELPKDKIPVFIGGKGVVVKRDFSEDELYVQVYPIQKDGSVYNYTYIDGETTSTVENNNVGWNPDTIAIIDTTSDKKVDFEHDAKTGAFVFKLSPGHDYKLTGGESLGILEEVKLDAGKTKLGEGTSTELALAGRMDDGNKINPAEEGAEIEFALSPQDLIEVDEFQAMALQEGKVEIKATVTLPDFEGSPVTVESNTINLTIENFVCELRPASFSLRNGQTKTIEAELTNRTGKSQAVDFDWDLPEDVNAEPAHKTDEILAESTKNIIFSLEAGENISAGTHTANVDISLGEETFNKQLHIELMRFDIAIEDDFTDRLGTEEKWNEMSRNWQINPDEGVYSVDLSAGESALTWAGEKNWQDYMVEVRQKSNHKRRGISATGIVFRYQDQENFYHLRFHAGTGLQLYKWVGGSAELITEVFDTPIEAEKWYDLTVIVAGNRIIGYLDGKMMIDVEDDSLNTGAVGMRVFGDKAAFDRAVVKKK